jgi:uncharacterized protein (TIGR02217 family)
MIVKEIRFPVDLSYGSTGGPGYSTDVSETKSGYETAILEWSQARHRYNAIFGPRTQVQLEQVLALFHAVRGMGYGFRFKDWADFRSSAKEIDPAATDQLLGSGDGSTLTFQLFKTYSYSGETYARTITKPVSGTTLVSIQSVTDPRWTVSTVTGIVTFSSNITKTINAITQAAAAQITFTTTHGLSVGHTFRVSGVVGMTQMNGQRVTVTVVDTTTQVTVNVNSTGYSAYTSDGTINTIPQSGELVKAGYEFDVPVRFDTDLAQISLDAWLLGAVDLPLVEIRV